jgi:hypothetical protein
MLTWNFVQGAASIVGFLVFIIAASVLGSAGIAAIIHWLETRPAKDCEWDNSPYCWTHACGPSDQCDLASCPHCGDNVKSVRRVITGIAHSEPILPGETPLDAMKRVKCINGDHTLADCVEGCPPVKETVFDQYQQLLRDTEIPDDIVFRVRFVNPQTMAYESDVEGLREVQEHLSNGDIIHYMRGERTHTHPATLEDDPQFRSEDAAATYEHYERAVNIILAVDIIIPHCDSSVLHAPGECVYCDKHPQLQQCREAYGINFTGKYDPNKFLCPSEARRPLDIIERWSGNRKYTESPIVEEFRRAHEAGELPPSLSGADVGWGFPGDVGMQDHDPEDEGADPDSPPEKTCTIPECDTPTERPGQPCDPCHDELGAGH